MKLRLAFFVLAGAALLAVAVALGSCATAPRDEALERSNRERYGKIRNPGTAVRPWVEPPSFGASSSDPDCAETRGRYDMGKLTVFAFSHNEPDQRDDQIVKFAPDIATRGWLAGWGSNQEASRYTVDFEREVQGAGILFMGGITGSSVMPWDTHDRAQFLDWVTRDASGRPVAEVHVFKDLYRGSLANPKYRKRLLDKVKMQIDLGVDGITVDEADANAYLGAEWDSNEGYDDYFIADFNRYLLAKYPLFGEAEWRARFGTSAENYPRRDIAWDDLDHNFNYRLYLRAHGWSKRPACPENPLAAEWGKPKPARLSTEDASFMPTALHAYWKEFVLGARRYARETRGKEILVTANGLYPYVDYNSVGLYDWNGDDSGKDVDYVPVTADGHLRGEVSLLEDFKRLVAANRSLAGDAPLLVFVDFPGRTIDSYNRLSPEEKKDFMRVRFPEAFAAGAFYCFHLKTIFTNEPSPEKEGLIGFMRDYASFYRRNAELFHGVAQSAIEAKPSADRIAANVLERADGRGLALHLLNRAWNRRSSGRGSMEERGAFSVLIPGLSPIASATMVSPDRSAELSLAWREAASGIEIEVPGLLYYDLVEIRLK